MPVEPTPRRHRTFRQKWALISLPNKFMVIATVVIAVATAANLWVARAMWREMHSGGKDTHTLAEQAKQQTANMQILAIQAPQQTTNTHDLADTAADQARSTSNLALAAETQATNTRVLSEVAEKQVDALHAESNNVAKLADETNKSVTAFTDATSAHLVLAFDFDAFFRSKKESVTLENDGPSVAEHVRVSEIGGGRVISFAPVLAIPDTKELTTNLDALNADCSRHTPVPGYSLPPQSKPKPVRELEEPQAPDVKAARTTPVSIIVACYTDIFNRPHHSDLCLFWNQKLANYQYCPTE